jgi:hypothetical protein
MLDVVLLKIQMVEFAYQTFGAKHIINTSFLIGTPIKENSNETNYLSITSVKVNFHLMNHLSVSGITF